MSIHANPMPDQIPEREELWQIVTTQHNGVWYATEPGVDATGSSEDELPERFADIEDEPAAIVSYLLQLNDSR